RRGWIERRLRPPLGPGRLDDRLEDRERNVCPGRSGSERAALAIAVGVTYPDGDRYIVGEADEPGIVFVLAGPSLAGHVGGEITDRMRGPTLHHSLHHRLQLIERGRIGRNCRNEGEPTPVNDVSVLLDGFDGIGRGSATFVGDGDEEGGE